MPQVKLPKRLDLARDAERAHEAVPGLIVANWVKRSSIWLQSAGIVASCYQRRSS